MDGHDHPDRRESDHSPAARLTGLSAQQLIVQLVGGLLLAAVVGLLSGWATQQVMMQQMHTVSRQLDDLRSEVRQMRHDLYTPRYRQQHIGAAAPAPGGPA